MSRRRKRALIVSDLHSGSLPGLTHPSYQQLSTTRSSWRNKMAALQREAWAWYANEIEELQPIDIVIANGDLIDGRGERSGSTELITSDRNVQASMAGDALKLTRASQYVLTYGTPYHASGSGEDFEDIVAKDLAKEKGVKSVKIGSHEWIDINGLIIDVKHKIGSSSVPYGRSTPLGRDMVWNALWSEREEQPKSDIFIRSHVHYHVYCGERDWLAMTTPALQTMGTKFGSRQCSGTIDFGFIHLDVDTDGSYVWQAHIAKLQGQKAHTLVL